MTLYKAKEGNAEFYIQPDMIEKYAQLGYTILKTEDVVVKDVKKEASKILNESRENANG